VGIFLYNFETYGRRTAYLVKLQRNWLSRKRISTGKATLNQILVELAGDQSLVRFKHEYDRLYRALRRSHDN